MESQRRDADLPEVNHEEHSYLYSVPDQTDPHSVTEPPNTKDYDHNQLYPDAPLPAARRKGFTRWWVLALIGLIIAIIAGLVGGFIGQAIQKGRESSTFSPSPSNGSSVKPPAGSSSDSNDTIVLPDTGCGWPGSKQRKRMPSTSTYSHMKFTTICNSGWKGNAEIIGIWTLTPSDCIESCARFNLNQENHKNTTKCVGGGFIPDWTNRTVGSRAQQGQPFNCFLHSTTDALTSNDQEFVGVEVVALCLQGQCDNVALS
ncbi:hypothetical protein FB567DRAFT_442838 [Paraphoma chrysanthemicola]|uniref:Uncharacterized protein n=1 Tax=Paraphoma chrysanthemicola TaxID=798071 RepID=A0A8K0R854_9PLEO|nr:hypothetical protein FB567DRAFT_442838 [Paraphoma chrysanthemicola]